MPDSDPRGVPDGERAADERRESLREDLARVRAERERTMDEYNRALDRRLRGSTGELPNGAREPVDR